jgi:hypothetical protein
MLKLLRGAKREMDAAFPSERATDSDVLNFTPATAEEYMR